MYVSVTVEPLINSMSLLRNHSFRHHHWPFCKSYKLILYNFFFYSTIKKMHLSMYLSILIKLNEFLISLFNYNRISVPHYFNHVTLSIYINEIETLNH
jgi:hypothetical protein